MQLRTRELGAATHELRRSNGLLAVEELLGFARSNGALRIQPVSLAQTASAVQDDLAPAIAAAEVQLTVEDFVGEADPTQLHTLPRVRITAMGVADRWCLQFADNGVGIPPEDRQRVLEPLVRLENEIPGTGLGLATCNRIAQAHGGLLELDETDGGGLTVRVWFGGTGVSGRECRQPGLPVHEG